MSRILTLLLATLGLMVGGCATVSDAVDAINPFSSSGPKLAPLPVLNSNTDVRTQWDFDLGKAGIYTFNPAVSGDDVYAADHDGVVAKISAGKLVWKINAGQPLSSGVGLGRDLLVVGTPKGDVLAFSTEDGKSLWRARVSSELLATPAVGDGVVAVRSGDNQIYLFDARTGSRKWNYQRATPALSVRSTGAPVFADQYVFAGFPGGKLVALSLQNGAPVWEGAVSLPKGATELDRVADVVATPAVDGRQLCAVAFQGRVACFDMAQGGAMVWSKDISSAVGLTLDGRYLFVVDDKGVVHALDRLSGSSLWKQDKLKSRRLSPPVVRRGVLAVGDAEGYVHLLSREDGSLLGRQKTDGSPIRAALQPLGASLIVQTSRGSVSAIEIQ